MSTSEIGGVAARGAHPVQETFVVRAHARLSAYLVKELWPNDRGLAELRWGAVAVAIMVVLGVLATVIDPAGADFVRLLAAAPSNFVYLLDAQRRKLEG